MKKVLLASTALVFSAGIAAAEMSLSGDANMGVKYREGAADELTVHWEIDFNVIGSGETDNGLTFGASIDLDTSASGLVVATPGDDGIVGTGDDGTSTISAISDGEVFVSGNFGTLTVGNVDPANDFAGFADIGFDGIGVDDDAEAIKNAASSADIEYTYSFGDFGVILTAHSTQEDFGIAFTYSGASFSGGIGYTTDEQTGGETFAAELGGNFGDFGVNVYVADWDGGTFGSATGYGLDVSYDLGDITLVAAVGSLDINAAGTATLGNDSGEDFGIGASYDLGGGATLAGGIGEVDSNLVADFGITMKF